MNWPLRKPSRVRSDRRDFRTTKHRPYTRVDHAQKDVAPCFQSVLLVGSDGPFTRRRNDLTAGRIASRALTARFASAERKRRRRVLALGFQSGAVVLFIHRRVAAERRGDSGAKALPQDFHANRPRSDERVFWAKHGRVVASPTPRH
jgi:hypothetical protein